MTNTIEIENKETLETPKGILEKGSQKGKKVTSKKKTKKVEVLAYANIEKFIIVAFEKNRNLRIDGVTEYPGKIVTIEYEGTPDHSDFKYALKK